MTLEALGQLFALLTAITWAVSLVLFKRSGETMPPLALNLFKNAIGIVLLLATLPVIGEGYGVITEQPIEDTYILIISGVIGLAVADTIFFTALNLCGVGIVSIVDCTYSPFTILFSFLLLGETLQTAHYVGGAMILTGVMISSRHAPPADRTRRQLLLGTVLAATSMAMMAFAIVCAKPVLTAADFPLITATLVRMLFGTILLGIFAAVSHRRKDYWAALKPNRAWRFAVPASILGAYLSMVFWLAGYKYAQASIAAILNQTSVIFAIVLATLFLKESFSPRKAIALLLAMAGVLMIVAQSA